MGGGQDKGKREWERTPVCEFEKTKFKKKKQKKKDIQVLRVNITRVKWLSKKERKEEEESVWEDLFG